MINQSKILDRKLLKRGLKFDQSLLWMIILMLSFSMLMIFSASIVEAASQHNDKWFFLKRQVAFVILGALIGLIAFTRPLAWWKKATPWLLFVCFILLVAVLGVGREINGAKRWIPLGVVNFQPSELFKLSVILYLASFFTRRAEILKEFKRVWYVGLPIALGLWLIAFEPDLGAMVVATGIALGLLFLADLPWRWFLGLLGIAILGVFFLIVSTPWRMVRMTAYLNPWNDPYDSGYQLTHALMAVGRGEWLGMGLGAGLEKFFLPEPHTDFIFAIFMEEFGFIGMTVLVFCYAWLVWRSFSIGKQARDLDLYFGSFVAYGIGLWLGIQSFINIGVNIGLLPTKGLTLPLMSYGGSSVVIMLWSIALLLRVDYENRLKMRGFKVET